MWRFCLFEKLIFGFYNWIKNWLLQNWIQSIFVFDGLDGNWKVNYCICKHIWPSKAIKALFKSTAYVLYEFDCLEQNDRYSRFIEQCKAAVAVAIVEIGLQLILRNLIKRKICQNTMYHNKVQRWLFKVRNVEYAIITNASWTFVEQFSVSFFPANLLLSICVIFVLIYRSPRAVDSRSWLQLPLTCHLSYRFGYEKIGKNIYYNICNFEKI